MTKWYEGVEPTAIEKHRMAHIRARVQYERQIVQGVIAGLIFLVGVVVGRLL